MCDVLYKLVIKILANKLKVVLPKLIFESQSSFVKDRLISDNVLIVYEVIHAIKNKRVGKEGYRALKLDMSKTYNRVQWMYLLAVMRKLCFSERWIYLVNQCISSVSYSIMINDFPGDLFVPQRGLRQRNPLSPYLFVIYVEGFLALLLKAELQNEIDGIQVCRVAPKVSHLFFLLMTPLFSLGHLGGKVRKF